MEITQYYPFLKSIPEEIKSKIDWEELYIPNSYESILLNELSELLGKQIVLYKKGYPSRLYFSLVTVLSPAKLNGSQKSAVEKYEEKFEGFCVPGIYDKPIRLSDKFTVQVEQKLK